METRKIAVACFIGGSICSAVALMFAPAYFWLGMIAGFIGGYVTYEFRQVLNSIPKAWQSARKGCSTSWNESVHDIKTWFSKPHPFLYGGILISIGLISCWIVRSNPFTPDPHYAPLKPMPKDIELSIIAMSL